MGVVSIVCLCVLFVCCKQKTAYEMRISDWSSDVCSSDLRVRARSRLPKAWTRTEADTYDRKESARLYAVATGVARDRPKVERAIELYLQDKTHLKTYDEAARVLASLFSFYAGRYMDEVADKIGRAPV